MVATGWLGRAVVLAAFSFVAPGAQALTLNVVGGGLEAENLNYGCPTAAGTCTIAQRDYSLTADTTSTGYFHINDDGTILTISLFVPTAVFDTTPAGAPVTFSSVTYSATINAPSFGYGPDSISFANGTGTVSGFVNGDPFSTSASVNSTSCLFPGGTGQCGISFGEGSFSNILGRDWRHAFNVTVVLPEPATAALIALGLAGLAIRARRA